MNIIRFLISKDYRHEYTRSFTEKLQNEQLKKEEAYSECKLSRQ